jgi:MscS family membrane protein
MPKVVRGSLLAFAIASSLFAQMPVLTKAMGAAEAKPAEAEKPPEPPPDPLGRNTPRGTVTTFLRLVGDGKFLAAADCFATKYPPDQAVQLSEQLGSLLNIGLKTPLSQISDQPEGKIEDGIAADRENIGSIEIEKGHAIDIVLHKVKQNNAQPIWLFSAETLLRVPNAHAASHTVDVESRMPKFLQHTRVLDAPLWRWLLLLCAIPVSFLATWLVQLILRIFERLAKNKPNYAPLLTADRRLTGPVRCLLLSVFFFIYGEYALTLLKRNLWERVGAFLLVIGFVWLLLRLTALGTEIWTLNAVRAGRSSDRGFIWLVQRAANVLLYTLGFLLMLSLFNIKITGLLAGLGLGGIAFAFAAQKTIENLFGGLVLVSDRPFRVGETVKIAEHMGEVMDVGIRSTTVRTLARTIVTIPNGNVATASVENLTSRDKFLFRPVFGVLYSTPAATVESILEQLREMLRTHPKIEPETYRVNFIRFADSWLELEIFAYVLAVDYGEFIHTQDGLHLSLMKIVEGAGTSFAFPSRTVYMEKGGETT